MTQEQYNRAVEINNRLEELETAKERLECNCYKLGYLCSTQNVGGMILGNTIIDSTMIRLTDIFDRHDNMIREEIDNEIEKLKKEIEEL